MKATDLLVRQLERAQEGFLRMASKVPADKLDWQPDPSLRSAADQWQEVATILEYSWSLYTSHEMKWDMDAYFAHKKASQAFDTAEKLEAELRRQTQKLIDHVKGLSQDDLELPVAMPFPGEYKVCDTIQYHVWNLAYHEGQIAAILLRLGIDPMG